VAETRAIAAQARATLRIEYEELPGILTIEEAKQAGSLLAPEFGLASGDVERALAESEVVFEGSVASSAQEHIYFETQRARAIPGEGREIFLFSGTQSPSEVQQTAARVLGLDSKDVTVDVKRLGGAFGGKESAATLWACLTALACYHVKRPVELRLSRLQDTGWTGKRHPFECRYRVGVTRAGVIQAYDVAFDGDGGAFADLTMAIMQRAVLHAENVYRIPNVRITARPWKTHVPPNTAFRGFGAPQGVFAIESVMQRIARELNLDPLELRKRNAYRENDTTPYGQTLVEVNAAPLMERCAERANYGDMKNAVRAFNQAHRFVKRGIGVVPVKFGISFTTAFLNQGSALVHLYTDGTVSVSHGGVEMGQGVNAKVARIVADEFGISVNRIRIESHNTKRTANTSPTAASTGADINGNAARNAAKKIVDRLKPVAAELLQARGGQAATADDVIFQNGSVSVFAHSETHISLAELAQAAWQKRVDLSAHGYYATPGLGFDWNTGRGSPFAYYVYGCGIVIAEVDVLTGYFTLTDACLVHETAESVDAEVDRGQIEGAFMQGVGWCTMEDVVRDGKGRTLSASLATYKIPAAGDVPQRWEVEMIQTERRSAGVKGSKAVGEPPFLYGEAAFFAIKDAIESLADYRAEAELRMPATPEAILRAVKTLRGKRDDL
ncbi:MAG: molybdopterin-dependent oxidoreductase, partial [bacterium]|nr:molybdopterin-dependent oxidoreductase [bacterium]